MTANQTHGIVPILGTMTFGAEGQVKPDTVSMMLRSFVGTGCTKTAKGALVDTARIHQSSSLDGDSESTLGQIFEMFPSILNRVSISTKASPMIGPHYSLSKESVIEQCNTSLEKLCVDSVDLFYLHSPDIKTDINSTLDGIEELHKAGKFEEFGLSNYPAWAVADIWHRCKQRGMVMPTVYQGKYNVLSRDVEREIVPVAREFGLRLCVYNPLAGGLLSGRYGTLEDVLTAKDGRFSEEFDAALGNDLKAGTVLYRNRYAKPAIFEGLNLIRNACLPPGGLVKEERKVVEDSTSVVDGRRVRLIVEESTANHPTGVDMANAALRWLLHHSCLRRGDGIIVGVSKNHHLVANLSAWQGGPLEDALLAACDAAWEIARPACESYFHGYGATPGGIDAFLRLKCATGGDDETHTDEPLTKVAKC